VSHSEPLLRRLLDEAADGLLALDEHGMILEANETAARLFQRRREFMIGKPLAGLLPVDERRGVRAAIAHAKNAATGDVELRRLPSGDAVTLTVQPASGFLVARLSRESYFPLAPPPDTRHLLERTLRRFPHAVLAVSNGLSIVFANPGARRLLGVSAVDIGRPLADDDLRPFAERLVRMRTSLAPTVIARDGRELRVTGVPGHGEEPALLLIQDVTQERMQSRVTAEFLRNASHQLRTPLTAITAAMDVLQAGAKDDPEQRERFLGHIEAAAQRMTRLTRSLLVLSRAQAGAEALQVDFVELAPVVERLARAVRARTAATVETRCAPGLAALGEADLIEETLAALLDNAVAHTKAGTITVSTAETDWNAEIEVADTGTGILPEHRDRVFEPFYRPWQGDGFGLGLAIARQAVEAMDGRIEISGMQGGGTRVRVRLPSVRVIADGATLDRGTEANSRFR